jgi:hypothetical protein
MEDDFKDYGRYSFFREYPDEPDFPDSMDGMQLAAGPSPEQINMAAQNMPLETSTQTTMRRMQEDQQAGVTGQIIPQDRTMREELAYRTQQALIENLGIDNARARKLAETIFGGESSGVPLGVGLVDFTPAVLPMAVQESGISAGKAFESAKRGEPGRAAAEYGIGVLQAAEAIPGVQLATKAAKKVGTTLAPAAGEMIENYAAKTGLTQFALPRVDSINRFSVGPSSIKPKVIAENKPLYRETNIDGLTDLLREDKQFSYSNAFVTDNPDIAIGQGANTGVVVKFRPNSVSGAENKKPMTGDLAGREYKADVLAPKSIESITFKSEADLKKVRSLAASVLKKDFERVTDGNKGITFVRKTQPTEIPVAPKTSTPEFKSWFGQSKVVDDKNKPMVVYHTGAFDADVIKSASQLATDADKASFKNKNNGIYFSKSATYSGMYGEGKQGATTYPVYLSIKNPLIIKSKADVTALGGIFNDTADSMFITPEKLKELKSKGYDGIVNDLHNEVVAFEPTQIKSVFNKGTFNPKDPRILYGGGMAGTGAAVKDKERK